MLVGLWRW